MFFGLGKKIQSATYEFFYHSFSQAMRQILDEEFHRPTRLLRMEQLLLTIYKNNNNYRYLLMQARQNPVYKKPYLSKEPLVSIRIATFNRAKVLTEKVIPSLLDQSYSNFEVVIVGDGCTDNTEELINKIGSKKIKFYNLPYRGIYPENPKSLWRVGGTYPMNEAAWVSSGLWICPSDDDDEFIPNHIEDL